MNSLPKIEDIEDDTRFSSKISD